MEHKLVPYVAAQEIPARSVLVIAPHADDEVLGCGGAILRHVELGVPVRVLVVTDGALGLEGEARAAEVACRQAECRAAAQVLGYGAPLFWDLPDQGVVYGEPLVDRLAEAIGAADLVYAPSMLEIHPDHRAIGMAAAEAVRRLGGERRIAFYEVGAPFRPNLLLDISRFAGRKAEAMAVFVSQLTRQRYDEHIAALNRYRTYTLGPEVAAAEGFVLASAQDLSHDPLGLYRSEYRRQEGLGLPPEPSTAPYVSVIVRSMNRPMLQDALDSIALQTHPKLEVVVVDARGTHSPLPDACGRFPMRLVSEGRALGRSRAANVGLEAARGEYLIFLDDDDLFLPNHVSRLVEALRAEPRACAAYAGVRVEAGSGVIDTYDEAFPPARLMAWNHLPMHAVLFARSLVEAGCRFDEAFDLYEDWDFWLQVQARGRLARAPGVSAVYRTHLGESDLTGEAESDCQRRARRQLWAKWLRLWRPEDMEALVAELHAARADRANDQALRRLLEAERATVAAQRWELDQRDRIVADQKASLSAIHASTSWRLTAPVRALLGLGRRRRSAPTGAA